MVEMFRQASLFCGVGKVMATVFIPAEVDLCDNTRSFVETPCDGCQRWSVEAVAMAEEELLREWGELSGIRNGRINRLEQLLVDRARIKGGESRIVVAYCTPVGC